MASYRWRPATWLPFSLLFLGVSLPVAPQNVAVPDAVSVPVSVSDAKGAPINDLKREDFSISDNGQLRPVQALVHDELPLTVGIVADVSGNELKTLKKQKDVIAAFLTGLLRPADRAFLATFDEDVRLAVDLTRTIDDLRNAIDQMKPLTHEERLSIRKHAGPVPNRLGEPCSAAEPTGVLPRPLKPLFPCNSSAWDGVFYTANLKMKALPGRKVLIVVSHGEDGGSARGVADAIMAAQSAGTVVYTVRPVDSHIKSNTNQGRAALANGFDRLADETGGKQFTTLRTPKAILSDIANDVRSLYVLSFVPPKEARDGKPHSLEVKVTKPGARIRFPKNYQ